MTLAEALAELVRRYGHQIRQAEADEDGSLIDLLSRRRDSVSGWISWRWRQRKAANDVRR